MVGEEERPGPEKSLHLQRAGRKVQRDGSQGLEPGERKGGGRKESLKQETRGEKERG